ncbi:MAG TPA: redox-sensing transcriptional repressor Rex [Atribacteraceae bacterium]|nr:redox-sensing transcriptional repressor Rex [Atribacteraceae bacterium]
MAQSLSTATVTRLYQYFQIFKAARGSGLEHVSSEVLSGKLGIDASSVRKDLAGVASGVQKLGYCVSPTLYALEDFLGIHNTKEAFLVGVGSLGRALLGYRGFAESGLDILAAFDVDEERIGNTIAGKTTLPLSKLTNLVQRLNVKIGIITVPADAAQSIADLMIASGMIAIWNFAPITLTLPADIIVRNENLAAGFSLLSYELKRLLEQTKESEDQ